MVVGAFPNWGDRGHDEIYPPEHEIDLNATYPGWYRPIQWRRWHVRPEDEDRVDLHAATSPAQAAIGEYGSAYAYAQFRAPERQEVRFTLELKGAVKVWLNGKLIHAARPDHPDAPAERYDIDAMIKEGRNQLLVKVSATPGPFHFTFTAESGTHTPLQINWWK